MSYQTLSMIKTDHTYVVVKCKLKLTRTGTSQRFTICAIAGRCYSGKKYLSTG